MAKAIPAVLVLTFICLFVLSSALPSVLSQIAFPQAELEPSAPRTLLGKFYRRCPDLQGCPPSCRIRSPADRNDSDAIATASTSTNTNTQAPSDAGSCTQAEIKTDAWVQVPLPLVLNAVSEFGPVRLRLVKSKTPSKDGSCSGDASVSDRARTDRTTTEDGNAQHAGPFVISERPEGKIESRKVSSLLGRKRLYGRGDWKSRLLEEY